MTEKVKEYIMDQRQGVDEYWLCDFVLNNIYYEFVFLDKDFSLWCVNIRTFDGTYWVINQTLSDEVSMYIYNLFLESIQ